MSAEKPAPPEPREPAAREDAPELDKKLCIEKAREFLVKEGFCFGGKVRDEDQFNARGYEWELYI
jgi:hypothetical protein